MFADQCDVIVTEDGVLGHDGRELTGDEITEVAAMLDRARLETLWREAHRNHPLGSWVTIPDQVYGKVVAHVRSPRGGTSHMLRIRTPHGSERLVPVAEVRPADPPRETS